ncbi:Os07g0440700, partial [Oryza sativa Japonica Group]
GGDPALGDFLDAGEDPVSAIFSPPAENLSVPVVFLACVLLFIRSCPLCS